MRITTNTMMRQYNRRLNGVLNSMNIAGTKVTTGRRYEKASEDPSSAIRGYKLRREFLQNDDHMNNLKNTQELFTSYESSMMQVSKLAEDAHVDVLTALNGTYNEEQRGVLANKLREMQKSMVMDMNVSVGSQYIFAGTGNKKPPFELRDDGTLLYRGIDVNSTDPKDQAMLKELANEKVFVDLGFGLSTKAGAGGNEIDQSTAFNTAISGIGFLGFGSDGKDSKNIVTLMGQLADELEKPDGVFDKTRAQELNSKFDVKRNEVIIDITKMGSNTMFLDYTQRRLDDVEFNLNSSIVSLEYMDPAEAITDFKMQDYIYRATLQMGMNILSPSFIDFMR